MWVELSLGSNGNLHTIKCKIYNEVEGKDKIFVTKWDSLCKHASWKKTQRNIGTNVKKGDWYHTKYCKHAKNHKLFVYCSYGSVARQPANGVAREN